MNYCPNCGNDTLDMIGICNTGGIYKCNKCKIKFSIDIINEGKIIEKVKK
jgi:ribosomal protein L37AE/L43A